MKNLTDYEESKKSLLARFDKIQAMNLLPVENITAENVLEKKKSLEKGRFIVSVCGQMKAGKSTLLNALVFGREVLPAADTVMTAKITTMKYAPDLGFEVYFYDENEWDRLKDCYESNESYKKDFESDIACCMEKGIYPQEVISSSAMMKKMKGLDNLSQYVALPQMGGVYTPFVKEVVVYHNQSWLKDVVIVDTPGINDPNEIRDSITKNWISQAHAVVYVTYASSAVDEQDVNFMDQYLLHVPSNCRILAVNKMDCVTDPEEAIDHVQHLSKSKDPRISNIFGTGDAVAYVSALGDLLSTMVDQGEVLNEENEDLHDMLNDKGYLDAHQHQMPQLRVLIESKLIKSKIANLIQSSETFISSIFDKQTLAKDADIAQCKENLLLLSKDDDELHQEKEKIKKQQADIISLFESFTKKLTKQLNDNNMQLRVIIDKVKTEIIKDALKNIRAIKSVDYFKNEVAWIVKGAIEGQQDYLDRQLCTVKDEVSSTLEREITSLRTTLEGQDLLYVGVLDSIVNISLYEALQSVDNIIDKSLATDAIHEIINENVNFFRLWMNTKDARADICNALTSEISGVIDKAFKKSLGERIIESLSDQVNETKNKIEYDINAALQVKGKSIETILDAQEDRNQKKKSLSEQLEQLKSDKDEVQRLKESLV